MEGREQLAALLAERWDNHLSSCKAEEGRNNNLDPEPRAWLALHGPVGWGWHGPEGELGRVQFKV